MIATLVKFSKSPEFIDAVVSSTLAGFGGGGYSVEVFPDGHYRVLDNMQIGNLYRSPGMIVSIPQLSDEEAAEVDEAADISLRDVVEFYRDELAAKMIDAASE